MSHFLRTQKGGCALSRQTRFLTAAEAAEVLRVGPWQIIKLCRDKELPATKPGKSWLIDPVDLDAYLAQHSNQREAS